VCQSEVAMTIKTTTGARVSFTGSQVKAAEDRDLNPGRCHHLTALAARGTAVRIDSSWTNPLGRPPLNRAARRRTATQTATLLFGVTRCLEGRYAQRVSLPARRSAGISGCPGVTVSSRC
jgi:hypothetical protein